MQKYIFSFRYSLLCFCLGAFLACSPQSVDTQEDSFTFAVLNVGQGLAQIGMVQGDAVCWDMGDRHTFPQWLDGYNTLGKPSVKAIVISHGDLDHRGGLDVLPLSIPFRGLVYVSPYEDTAAIRSGSQEWSFALQFNTVAAGDTLALLTGVSIVCIWPPVGLDSCIWTNNASVARNRLSLCFKVAHGNTSLCITGDIDTVAEEALVNTYTHDLSSDIVIVPHHGSRGSLHPLFYGYMQPEYAVISCGIDNPYGHPSDEVVKFLALQLLVTIHDTRYNGHAVAQSNGEYWVW